MPKMLIDRQLSGSLVLLAIEVILYTQNSLPSRFKTKWFILGVVQFLLEKGANPNHVDNDNWSPLRTAAQNPNPKVVKLLLEYGKLI